MSGIRLVLNTGIGIEYFSQGTDYGQVSLLFTVQLVTSILLNVAATGWSS